MKKLIIILVVTVGIITAWFLLRPSKKTTDGFTIIGTVTGFADSTKLYLQDATPGQKQNIIDSTQIVNGKFTLKGKISAKTINVMLTTKNNEDYTFLWIENTDMSFTAAKGKFHDAIITGSETEQDEQKLDALVKPIHQSNDSLNQVAQRDSFGLNHASLVKQFDALREKEVALSAQFVKEHPGSIVSAETLNTYATSLGKDKTQPLYNNLAPEIKGTIYGKNIAEYLSLNKNLKVGDKYADFSLTTPDGKIVKLSDFAGKVVLLNFWASWCGPCRGESPSLVATYRQYKSKGFAILGVSLDADKKEWFDAIAQDGLEWANVSDLRGDRCVPALMYSVSGIPDNFLIGKDGIIIARNLHGQELQDKLQSLLK